MKLTLLLIYIKETWLLVTERSSNLFAGVGRIIKERNGCIDFTISSLNQIITQVIPHFDKYPMITQKRADYLLFKQTVMIMQRG